MRFVLYGDDGQVGLLVGDLVVDAATLLEGRGSGAASIRPCCAARGITGLIEAGPGLMQELAGALEAALADGRENLGGLASDVALRPAAPSLASRFLMTGANNAAHVAGYYRRHGSDVTDEEYAEQMRAGPIMGFWKFPHNAVGHDGIVAYPGGDGYLDYEAEVAVVIGRTARHVPAAEAGDHIWGYTILNDLGLRYQEETKPYNLGVTKNFDGALAIGPALVAGEPFDVDAIPFETRVNGELRQAGNTKEMVFSFAELIAYFSSVTTLHPGDVISGGTCAGTAADSSDNVDGIPDRNLFLKPGDVVEVWSPAVGTLRTAITPGLALG